MSRRRLAAAGLTACLLASGCTTGEPEQATPSPTTGTTTPGSPTATVSPTALDLEPADGPVTGFDRSREIVFPEEQVVDAAAPPGQVLTLTGDLLRVRSLPTLETAYEHEPVRGSYVDLWVDADAGTGYTLAIEHEQGGGTSVGSDIYVVDRFDLDSGQVTGTALGRIEKAPTGSAQGATGQVARVLGDVVMVASSVPGTFTPPTAVALDVGSGKLAWHRPGASVLAAAAGTVVLGTGRGDSPGDVRGVHPEAGRPRWRAARSTTAASVLGVRGSVATLATTESVFGGSAVTRVSLRSGRTVAGRPRAVDTGFWACPDTGSRRVVCTVGDGSTVVGWDLVKHRESWSLPASGRFAPTVTAVEDGFVYGRLDDGTGVVLEASSGEDVVADAGASPIDVNEFGGVTVYLGLAVFTPQGTPAG